MSNDTLAGFRLSIQQERLWSQQTGGPSPFWAECELLLEGPLDAVRLREAIRRVVGRHEILRTVFPHRTGLKFPLQVISDRPDFTWQEVNLAGLDDTAQSDKIREFGDIHKAEFDLEHGPSLFVLLAKLAPHKHILVLVLPALCADLRSLQNLATEIGRCYAGGLDSGGEVMQYRRRQCATCAP